MTETSTESRPAHVVKFRGGLAVGVFRLALGRVPPGVVVQREGASQPYEYAGSEEQVEHSNAYDANAKRNVRVSRSAAVYHIFRPAGEA